MAEAVTTTLKGLIVTCTTWWRDPKQTIEYPDVDIRTGEARPRGGSSMFSAKRIVSFLYPDVPQNKAVRYDGRLSMKISDRYRGILTVDIEICTACLACSRACPIDCIQIDAPKEGKLLRLERFDIDIALCMYCGLCSSPCPTGAIHHTKEFEASTTDFPDLIRRFVDEPRIAFRAKKLKTPLGVEPPPEAAPAAAPAASTPPAAKS